MAQGRSVRLSTDFSACDSYVRTDRQRCHQVLLNLLSNAVKYNYDGGTVSVSCRPLSEDMLRISIADTGPGIDPSRQERLFQPFERLGAESSGIEGTGLGLALTKHLVAVIGGSIGVDSSPGAGSTFWIDLPLTEAPAEAEAGAAEAFTPDSGGHGRTLLLVEDNLANLKLVEAMLRRRPDVSVISAMQGRLAMDLAHQHRPDAIILDLHLPDVPGQELLHRLQADPVTRGIPVVIASADATPNRIRRLREEGAFDSVTKPLDVERFLEVVDAAFAHQDRAVDGRVGPREGGD
jgi:CheY-like chemotaxis protein